MVVPYNSTATIISWTAVDCLDYNGIFLGYNVSISNDTTELTYTSYNEHIITNDLMFGNTYNISVAVVNQIGIGPANTIEEESKFIC